MIKLKIDIKSANSRIELINKDNSSFSDNSSIQNSSHSKMSNSDFKNKDTNE